MGIIFWFIHSKKLSPLKFLKLIENLIGYLNNNNLKTVYFLLSKKIDGFISS
jgi:hypothetical protein